MQLQNLPVTIFQGNKRTILHKQSLLPFVGKYNQRDHLILAQIQSSEKTLD